MKRILLLLTIIICVSGTPKHGFSQGVHDAWKNSYSKSRHDALTKAVTEAIEKRMHPDPPKPSYKERMADRQEAIRQREIWNNIEEMSEWELLCFIDNSDYRSKILTSFQDKLKSGLASSNRILEYFDNDEALRDLILKDSSLREKMKDEIARKREKILDYAQKPHLNEFIMSDPTLRYYYIQIKEKRDIKRNPRKVIEDIRDPKLRQIIEEDPELVRILAQEIEKKAQEDRELQERLDADEKAEQNRKKREREKETTRIVDENNRASEQTKKNKIEQTKNKNLQDELKSSPIFVQLPDVSSLNTTIQDPDALKVKPIDIFGINYTDDLSTKGDDKLKKANLGNKTTNDDDNLYDQSYLEQKWDGIKYDAKDNVYKINKQFEISKKEFSTRIKKIPDNARRKVEAVPITWVENKTKNIVNFAYPGAEMYETSKVQIKSGKEQVKLFEGILSCISDAVDAGVSGKFDIFECIKPSVKVFTDEQLSNTESLTHMKIRRYIPFLKKSKINENEE